MMTRRVGEVGSGGGVLCLWTNKYGPNWIIIVVTPNFVKS